MTVLLQNRTISMIIMVPDVELLAPSSTPNIEKLDRSDIDTSSSMPVYHGSIIRIEKHNDDQNASDLIVRVPNFQRLSLPSSDTDSEQPTRIKRRAPICPILNGSNLHSNPNLSATNSTHHFPNLNLNQSRVANTNRLTTGLRSLSRAFTHGCKSKRSSSISGITLPSALPDVEVMTEKVEVSTSSNKNKNSTTTMPKLSTPKILFIKRKHSKIKMQPPSSTISSDTQTDRENNRINLTPTSTIITTQYAEVIKNNSPKITTFIPRFIEDDKFNREANAAEVDDNDDDDKQENESMRLNFDVDQHFAAISQLISDIPISSIDADSLSTHRYSTISAFVPDIRISITDHDTEDVSPFEQPSTGISYDFDTKPSSSKINRPFRVQTSSLQPDISVIRMGTNDLRTGVDRRLPGETFSHEETNSTSNIEQDWHGIIRSNDETFVECYEVTYQIDPRFQNENEQITDQSSVLNKINLDPLEYKNLASTTTTSSSLATQNEYEQIEHDNSIDHNLEYLKPIPKEEEIIINNNIPQNKSCSVDDLSQTSNDQTSTYQPESITSSDHSSRHCTLQRLDSYDGFGIYVSTDIETHREHFIRQVEELSPGEQAGLKENDRILCINGTPVINEEYTVVLQLIKHGLQTDTLDFDVITNDAYEEFKSQIDQLYQ